jgi:hypothetical protein
VDRAPESAICTPVTRKLHRLPNLVKRKDYLHFAISGGTSFAFGRVNLKTPGWHAFSFSPISR